MRTISLPQLPWHGTQELKLPVPDTWQVEFYPMAGWNRPALKPVEIQSAIATPIGISPLRKLARGKNNVAIIFDDMTRVTRAAEIIPFVLKELTEAGIQDNKIRFICALGCHGAHNRLDFEKKLGKEIVARFPVYNHNPFAHCTYVGTTRTYGTKVYINEEVMKCDLKIAIGLVTPHPGSGFGGGGKIIMPGVASFETVEHNHRATMEYMTKNQNTPIFGMGIFDDNPMRLDIEEAATLTGLDVLINCIINMWGETVSIFSGALIPAYTAAVREARSHYLTSETKGENIVIANTFAKASEAIAVGLGAAFLATPPQGGDIILIANAPDGQVTHYLMGTFGRETAGKLGFRIRVPQHVNRVCIFSEYPDVTGRDYIEESDKVFFTHKWDEVLETFPYAGGSDAKVAVYPNADIQYNRYG
jgi:nickel-dependent lactate racemase